MRLSDLLDCEKGTAEVEVVGLSSDSRKVRPGYLFAALSGRTRDGITYIQDAVEQGAVAILAPPGTHIDETTVRLVVDANPRQMLARMAARFHGRQPATVVAVTGTNGKTSVVSFTRQLWSAIGNNSASLGTLGVVADSFSAQLSHTTPEPVTLHALLADMADRGINHLAIEASSHGLDQHRLDGVVIQAAAFTNLSRDHLDYHGDQESYFAAKKRLISEVMSNGVAVLNADCNHFSDLNVVARRRGHQTISYGLKGQEVKLVKVKPGSGGQDVEIELLGRRHKAWLPLVGAFQVSNVMCALGLVVGGGVGPHEAAASISNLRGVDGRLDLVAKHSSGAPIYVDYAHTPGALESVLIALRPHVTRSLWVIFGCGGGRDRGKRGEMGAVAQKYADRVIVTDDNPRDESPEVIRKAILDACPKAQEVSPRDEAIALAVDSLTSGDVLVVAGKGHEENQTIGSDVLPFNDGDVIRDILGSPGRVW